MKNQNGITLIALVITIIVLLILAGVAIAAISGNNGILDNATKAAEYNAIGETKDAIALDVNENVTNYLAKAYGNDENAYTGQENSVQAVIDKVLTDFQTTNGTEVSYSSNKITITATKYKCEGTVNATSGAITWESITEVTE